MAKTAKKVPKLPKPKLPKQQRGTPKLGTAKAGAVKPGTLKQRAFKPETSKPEMSKPEMSKLGTSKLATAAVLDSLFEVVLSRREAEPSTSHSARLLSRGRIKVAQKFGEEAVECLIEAVAGNRVQLVSESADVLYHLLVVWVDAGIVPSDVWAELERRQGVSGIAEKASRSTTLAAAGQTRKIP